jgi:hypothetical protein
MSEVLLVSFEKITVADELVIGKKTAHSLDTLAFHELNPMMYLCVGVSRS